MAKDEKPITFSVDRLIYIDDRQVPDQQPIRAATKKTLPDSAEIGKSSNVKKKKTARRRKN